MLDADTIWRYKIAMILWAQRQPEAETVKLLAPGTRAWMRKPDGTLVPVKLLGEQSRESLGNVQEANGLKVTRELNEETRAFLDKTGLVPPRVPADHPPAQQVPADPHVDVVLSQFSDEAHGHAPKTGVVLHETISHDVAGLTDITGVANYLDGIGYGIHAIVDLEGHIGKVPVELETAVFWQCQGANLETIGIEQVSMHPMDPAYWWTRGRELRTTAVLVEQFTRRHSIPLRYDPHAEAGVFGHADVTHAKSIAGGHTDCTYPLYPTLWVVNEARRLRAAA